MNENIVKIIFNFVLKTSGLKVKFWIIFAFFGGEGRDGFDTDNIKVLLLKKKKKPPDFPEMLEAMRRGGARDPDFRHLLRMIFLFQLVAAPFAAATLLFQAPVSFSMQIPTYIIGESSVCSCCTVCFQPA